LPICSKVFDIISEKITPKEAVNDLLIREQKKEFV
jgi:glycerol-3-phosphate dehydrogenase